MNFREAQLPDIEQLQVIRNSVKENALSDPSRITYDDYSNYLFKRGKGWVCEVDHSIVGFSIVDNIDKNIWALFVHPSHEKKGIGRKLQALLLDWYFNQKEKNIWLSTAPNTRAEAFYRMAGWKETGRTDTGEIRFEISADDWKRKF